MKTSGTYGLIAEFEDPTALVSAAHRAYQAGYRRMDAYSPFPIEELHEAIPMVQRVANRFGGWRAAGQFRPLHGEPAAELLKSWTAAGLGRGQPGRGTGGAGVYISVVAAC